MKLKQTNVTLSKFVELFRQRWLSQLFCRQKLSKSQELKQVEMSVHRYIEKIHRLLQYIPELQDNETYQLRKYIMGLNNRIGCPVCINPSHYSKGL